MEYRTLEINAIAAMDVKAMDSLTTTDTYVMVRVSTDPRTNQRTSTYKDGHKNPTWNCNLKFIFHETALQSNSPNLVFSLLSEHARGGKPILEVHVPLEELLQNLRGTIARSVSTASGEIEGFLEFSYKFGQKISVQVQNSVEPPQYWVAPPPCGYSGWLSAGGHYPNEPAGLYSAQGYNGYPAPYAAALPSAGGYHRPPPPQHGAAPYPAPYAASLPSAGGYYPPPPSQNGAMPYPAQGYNGYLNHPQPVYGYPNNQNPGYNGGGLLGGLMVGNMIADWVAAFAAGLGAV